jgi:hypothetical protein
MFIEILATRLSESLVFGTHHFLQKITKWVFDWLIQAMSFEKTKLCTYDDTFVLLLLGKTLTLTMTSFFDIFKRMVIKTIIELKIIFFHWYGLGLGLWCFNNISVIVLQSVLLVEETGVPGENHYKSLTNFIT